MNINSTGQPLCSKTGQLYLLLTHLYDELFLTFDRKADKLALS